MNRPTCIILVGIPGSGKTRYAKKLKKTLMEKKYCFEDVYKVEKVIHLASDDIRKELYGDESIQDNPAAVFELMQRRAVEALNEGRDVIYDATNITRRDRASIISKLPKFVNIECHIVWAPIETCVERDAARERTVGKEVIDKMVKRFQAVWYDEGVDKIKIIKPNKFSASRYASDYTSIMNIPHDNPHHTLNVIEHCKAACQYIKDQYGGRYFGFDLFIAAMLHDIGKPYTKTFINAKGEPDEIAHFYGHQGVGAWLIYGYDYDNTVDIINVAWLISTHMDPYLNAKYYSNLPKFLKEEVGMLHEADKNAH